MVISSLSHLSLNLLCVCSQIFHCACAHVHFLYGLWWQIHAARTQGLIDKQWNHSRRQSSHTHTYTQGHICTHTQLYRLLPAPTNLHTSQYVSLHIALTLSRLLTHTESVSEVAASVTDWVVTVLLGLTDKSMGCISTRRGHRSATCYYTTVFFLMYIHTFVSLCVCDCAPSSTDECTPVYGFE